ncbi:phage tail spike protein [Aquibacillus rhizosphaerae]|uniref:Phage tail spike protein n=1 Tax=Aquibacillus rhizosphaerae TaxID=3051431 RepID=A0ABT7LC39_9BACI|nr:phage tail spike protein [Aquibacillus sp. LR5S19]MDL4842842.1 phage tail spike protein [Aquibacillus sp. LR5S19]
MSEIFIADGQTDTILDVISKENILSNQHRKSLQNNLETFQFETFADKRFSKYLGKRNRVIIPSEDGEFIEFVIFEAGVDRIQRYSEVYTSASYLDLKKTRVIAPHTTGADSAEVHTINALSGAEWQPGTIAYAGVRTIIFDNYTNPFAYLKKVASEFGLELRFRIEHDGSQITGRYVDLVERVGDWRGRTVEFGQDLLELRRIEKTDQIVTALRGVFEKEDGTRLDVLVTDEDALQRWGRNGRHLIEVYEPQSTNQDMTEEQLTQYTRTELNKRINASVEYKGGIADLEHMPGMENKRIRFADTIRIKDTSYDPSLYLEARIHTMDRDIVKKGNKKVTLGDYEEFTEDEVKAIWKSLQTQISKKMSELQVLEVTYDKNTIDGKDQTSYEDSTVFTEQYAEKKKVMSTTAPTDKSVIWVDNSNPDNVVWKVWDGTEWKLGPSGPKGEDGYTPIKGVDYFDGLDGQDGTSSYLWVRYSQNSDGSGMTTDPTNAVYIGVVTTTEPIAPTSYTSYTWTLIKGSDGVKGETGSDGKTSHLHIRYSNDGGNTFTANNGETVGTYIGTYVDFSSPDSNNVSDYTWNRVKGEKGDTGPQGVEGPIGPEGAQGPNIVDGNTSFGEAFNTLGKNYYYQADVVPGDWYRIAYNSGNRAHGKFILKDITSSNHAVLTFEASVNYGSRPTITVLSSTRYGGTPVFQKVRIVKYGVYDPVYLEVFIPSNSRSPMSVHCWITENIQSSGWVGLDWEVGSIPTGYTTYTRNSDYGDTSQDVADNAQSVADSAKTTADGKNTVLYSPTQPSTTGRKTHDVWFDIDNDYKMYRFDGSLWVEAPFGESAIIANSITANHIKSLLGLNVNDQFIVDANGNVTFAGKLNGADGNFSGSVSTDKDMSIGKSLSLNTTGTLLSDINFIRDGILQGRLGSTADGLVIDLRNQRNLTIYGGETQGGSVSFDIDTVIGLGLRVGYVNDVIDFKSSGDPTTMRPENGFCGTGARNTESSFTGAVSGVGVNFRTKKTYIPSSVGLSGTSYTATGRVANITKDGFWLYVNKEADYSYWRGNYNA